MQTVRREFDELNKPTARCFKGLAILLFIWGFACILIYDIVPTIIFTHLDDPVKLSNAMGPKEIMMNYGLKENDNTDQS